MFWEVFGIGSEVIGLLWNLSFLEYFTRLFFLGSSLSLFVLPFYFSLGHSCFLTLVPDCCFSLLHKV